MSQILFVCTANICRSPMAEALMRFQLQSLAWGTHPGIASAGTWAKDGLPASAGACRAMARRGLDLTHHRSRRVTGEMVNSAQIIITMERGHQEALSVEFPHLEGRIFLLTELAGQIGDVADPYGGPDQDYERCAAELDELLRAAQGAILRGLAA